MPDHAHHYRIDDLSRPDQKTVGGTCKFCGARREDFKPLPVEMDWSYNQRRKVHEEEKARKR